jgi:YVTN family beta-propeller protein
VSVGFTPFELAVRPDGARLFVINRAGGDVSVIDTANNTVTTTVDVGFGASGLGQFVVPAVLAPRFPKAARKCQNALALQAAKFAKLERGLEAKCRLGIIKAEAAGKGTAKAEAACAKALDLGSPIAKLFRARAKAIVATARGCRSVVPRQINGPCARGAANFSDTGACVLAQHIEQVGAMMTDEFSATRPSPLDAPTRACQTAISKNGRRYADKLHKDLLKCLDKELAATDVGSGEAKAVATCLAKLDLGSPLSAASVARATGIGAMAVKCQGLAPAALGSPCDAGAPTLAATAECVLNGHAARVAKMVAAEFNDACVTLTRIGLAGSYPAVCSGH